MAKIKVKGYSNPYEGDGLTSRIVFSLVSSPSEGRVQISQLLECRGYVCEMAGAAAYGKRLDFPMMTREADVDLDKLRLLVASNFRKQDEFKKRLFKAKKFINVLEKYAGWKNSKIATVENDAFSEDMWLITGPKEWMSAPGLLSAFMLILRGITSDRADKIEFKGTKDIEKVFKGLAKSLPRNSYGTIMGTDGSDFDSLIGKFKAILKNHESIFKGTVLQDRYIEGIHGLHSNGAVALCLGETGDGRIDKRIQKL